MISRALSLLVILPSFAFGLLFVATDGFAPPRPDGCGTAAMAALMFWVLAALVSVFVPALLAGLRRLVAEPTGDLKRLAGVALAGHAALVAVGCLRSLLG